MRGLPSTSKMGICPWDSGRGQLSAINRWDTHPKNSGGDPVVELDKEHFKRWDRRGFGVFTLLGRG